MPDTYVRFVTLTIDEDSGRRRGVFQAVSELIDAREVSEHEIEELHAIGKWFNEHLGVPDRFARSARRHAASKAISWFKSSATAHLDRMHAVSRILNEHG